MAELTQQVLDSPLFDEVIDAWIGDDPIGMIVRLEKMTDEFPDHPIVLSQMGYAYELLDDENEAYACFLKAQRACFGKAGNRNRHPALRRVLSDSSCWVADFHRKQGKLASAETVIRHVLDAHCVDADLWLMLADIHRDDADYHGAIDTLYSAYGYRPDTATLDRIGQCCRALGERSEAVRVYERAAENSPKSAGVWSALAWARIMQGRFDLAERPLARAFRIERGSNPAILNLYAYALCENGKPRDAIKHARRAVELEPDTAQFWDTLSHAYIGVARYDDAIEAALKSITLNWGEVEAWYHLGVANNRAGKKEKAKEIFQRLKAMDLAWAGLLADELFPLSSFCEETVNYTATS